MGVCKGLGKELSREAAKLRVRLEDYLQEVDELKKRIDQCLERLEELSRLVEGGASEDKIREACINAFEALSEAMRANAEALHEGSHLLESYAALILEVARSQKR